MAYPTDRQIAKVPYPKSNRLMEQDLFHSNGNPSISKLTEHLKNEGLLDERCGLRLIELAKGLFSREPNMIAVHRPLTIVADIHGQFYDLLTILAAGGDPANTKYLFLGDYVDRGQFECECIFLLFALKINFPQNINLLRGNHETRQMTKAFQFKIECKKKYSSDIYNACMDTFDTMPVCALVDKRFLCMHGGISPDIRTLKDIERLNRFSETPTSGPLCDLLWCDPAEDFDDVEKPNQPNFAPNNVRGCGYFFSYYACRDFLLNNNLLGIIRGHEVQKNGVRFFRKSSRTNFPVLISLFSAPNYCDTYNNVAAILKFDENKQMQVIHIEARPHPFVLPNYENAFQFGERFILYYVTQLLLNILNMYSPDELADEDGRFDKTGEELLNKKRLIQTMERAYADVKKTNKIALNLRGLTPSYKAYKTLLERDDVKQLIAEAEKGRIKNYDQAIELDQIFERRPGT